MFKTAGSPNGSFTLPKKTHRHQTASTACGRWSSWKLMRKEEEEEEEGGKNGSQISSPPRRRRYGGALRRNQTGRCRGSRSTRRFEINPLVHSAHKGIISSSSSSEGSFFFGICERIFPPREQAAFGMEGNVGNVCCCCRLAVSVVGACVGLLERYGVLLKSTTVLVCT